MSGLPERIRKKVARTCLVRKLNKNGCFLPLDKAPTPRIIVDFDKKGSPALAGGKKGDYVVVAARGKGGSWIVPIEIKKGSLHAKEAHEQVQAAASAMERFLRKGEKFVLKPVVAAKRVRHDESQKIKRLMVTLRGVDRRIDVISCGTPLRMVFKD